MGIEPADGWLRPGAEIFFGVSCQPGRRCYNSRPSFGGAVAQLGERLVRNEKVSGSIPLGSTNSQGFSASRPAASIFYRSRDPLRIAGYAAGVSLAFD